MEEKLIGKYVIVRANVAGVHAGCVESVDFKTQTITLTGARRLWRIYTRDSSGAISDVAANGLKDGADHSIGAMLPSVTIVNPAGLEIAEMTPGAWESVRGYGSGTGFGSGSGTGYGYGYGDGTGNGSGTGGGSGSGTGFGSGSGYGYGYGDGTGNGILQ